MGKGFVLVGALLLLLSLLLLTGPKIPLPGKSPGDFPIARDNFQCSFPLIDLSVAERPAWGGTTALPLIPAAELLRLPLIPAVPAAQDSGTKES